MFQHFWGSGDCPATFLSLGLRNFRKALGSSNHKSAITICPSWTVEGLRTRASRDGDLLKRPLRDASPFSRYPAINCRATFIASRRGKNSAEPRCTFISPISY